MERLVSMTHDSDGVFCFQESQTPVPLAPVTMVALAFTTLANTSVTVLRASLGGTAR